jgi:ABC-type polysaccharide/polyol phosphate export permease
MVRHLSAVWAFRHFLVALVGLDLKKRYRKSAIGLGWTLLQPVAMTAVFVVLFSNILGQNPRTYTTYLLVGMTVWGFLRDCALSGCHSLLQNESFIRQCSLPYALYPLRTVLGQAIHSSVALLVGLLAVVILEGSPAAVEALWMAAPALALVFVCGWALATIFAFANVYFHDVQHLLEVGAQVMFFITPIMYEPRVLEQKGLKWMVVFNPVNLFLELIRTPIVSVEHTIASPVKSYLYAVGFTVLLVALAVGTVARLRKRVIFQM